MKTCKVNGCNNKHFALKYCRKHYKKYRKYGDPLFTKLHYMTKTTEYQTWEDMKARCLNKNSLIYKYYGGRGIKVCDRWLHSFTNFYKDMGEKPFSKAELDRINNEGNYEPSNCEWVTHKNNCRHTRNVKLTMDKANNIRNEYKNGNYTQRSLGLKYKVSQSTIKCVLNYETWA